MLESFLDRLTKTRHARLRRENDYCAGDPRAGRIPRVAAADEGNDRILVGVAAWDISTGDPLVPLPEVIGIPRVLITTQP
jgi:hypothetical protein